MHWKKKRDAGTPPPSGPGVDAATAASLLQPDTPGNVEPVREFRISTDALALTKTSSGSNPLVELDRKAAELERLRQHREDRHYKEAWTMDFHSGEYKKLSKKKPDSLPSAPPRTSIVLGDELDDAALSLGYNIKLGGPTNNFVGDAMCQTAVDLVHAELVATKDPGSDLSDVEEEEEAAVGGRAAAPAPAAPSVVAAAAAQKGAPSQGGEGGGSRSSTGNGTAGTDGRDLDASFLELDQDNELFLELEDERPSGGPAPSGSKPDPRSTGARPAASLAGEPEFIVLLEQGAGSDASRPGGTAAKPGSSPGLPIPMPPEPAALEASEPESSADAAPLSLQLSSSLELDPAIAALKSGAVGAEDLLAVRKALRQASRAAMV